MNRVNAITLLLTVPSGLGVRLRTVCGSEASSRSATTST